jgi:hypothetical protein
MPPRHEKPMNDSKKQILETGETSEFEDFCNVTGDTPYKMFLQYLESEGFEFRPEWDAYRLVLYPVLWDDKPSEEAYQVKILFHYIHRNIPIYVIFKISTDDPFNHHKLPYTVLEYGIHIKNLPYGRQEFNFMRMLIQKSMAIINKMRPIGSSRELANALKREVLAKLE